MTTREAFLSTVRDRLRQTLPSSHLRPVAPVDDDPIRYAVDLSDPQAAFVAAATAVGAETVGLPDDQLQAIVEGVIDEVQPSRVAVTEDPECGGVAEILVARGIDVIVGGDPAVVATADLGISGAIAGVALTGSLVVDSGRARTRLASLLPEVHLAFLRTDRIVRTPGDLLRDVAGRFPRGLPSNLTLITGPSRSADIELVITIGVHGPRRVLVALR